MRVVVQRVLESWGRTPRVAATVRHGHTPASLLISRLQASARQNDLTPTTTLWPRRSSVCARPYPSERKGPWRDLGRLEYVDWFSHRRPRPPKPNASPCLPPPSSPGTPPTSVQLSTTVYQHINLHRRNDVTTTTTPPPGQLRPLTAAQTDAFCTDAGSTPTAKASSPISPAASPDPNYATNGTKAPAATCASTSTGPGDSKKILKPEANTATAVPRPNQYQRQPRPQSSPDSDSPFR